MPGISVASLALGSRRLYDYMDYRKDLVMKDVAWTNDPFRIRRNPKSWPSTRPWRSISRDRCAPIRSASASSRASAQHDFMYGGALSEGGKTFIAMPSMTPKGESKIKALLTTLR